MKGTCTGEHFCCWVPITDPVSGELRSIPCPHSRDDGPDAERRYVCTLRESMGSWEKVRESTEYQTMPGKVWDDMGTEHCDEWPQTLCGACGHGTPVEKPKRKR